MSRAGPLLD
ncbi:hypothetical protein FQN60_016632, partial [Etheostoma spectabile]